MIHITLTKLLAYKHLTCSEYDIIFKHGLKAVFFCVFAILMYDKLQPLLKSVLYNTESLKKKFYFFQVFKILLNKNNKIPKKRKKITNDITNEQEY